MTTLTLIHQSEKWSRPETRVKRDASDHRPAEIVVSM